MVRKCFGLLVGLFLFISSICTGAPIKVFILHSYEKNHVCGQPQEDGFLEALSQKDLEIEHFYMDSKRNPLGKEKQTKLAIEQINKTQPDILFTIDDNAFELVAMNFIDVTFPNKKHPLTIIFSGLNGQPEVFNKRKTFFESRKHPGHNVTGVYEKLHILEAIKVHNQLFEKAKEIRVIVDSISPTGRAITRQIELELASKPVPWSMKIVKNWEEYQQEIFKANNNPAIGGIYPVALQLKDKNGKTFTAPDIFAWTIKYSQKPELALNYAFSKLGLFGGAAVDFRNMGEQAGQMAKMVIEGKTPADIAIAEAEDYALAFNVKRAKQLHIEIPEEILAAADIIYKE